MTPNVNLLKLTLKHCEMAPCTWDQEWYRRKAECGTVMCYGGWAATLAGGRWYGPADGVQAYCLLAEDGDDPVLPKFDGKRLVAAPVRAQRVLGLTCAQAALLFDSDNTLADLHLIVDKICAERPVTGVEVAR